MSKESKTERKAAAEIARLVSEARERIRQAEELARRHRLSFRMDLAYGMGGEFIGDPEEFRTAKQYANTETGWVASSETC